MTTFVKELYLSRTNPTVCATVHPLVFEQTPWLCMYCKYIQYSINRQQDVMIINLYILHQNIEKTNIVSVYVKGLCHKIFDLPFFGSIVEPF